LDLDLPLKQPSDHEPGSDGAAISVPALYRLDLSYIGEKYHGFQSQPSGNTIQDHLETALATFCRHPVRITAASRTDTGVHAEHQVVTFRGAQGLSVFRIVKALNSLLSPDIRVMSAIAVVDRFHPTFESTGKAYRYRIWRSAGESPFVSPFAWRNSHPMDVSMMIDAARQLIGTHDFTSFCAVDSSAKSKIRRVREIVIFDRGAMLEIWVVGDGFLKQMVRNIVGLLVAVGRGKIGPAEVKGILEAKDRQLAPATAPACGLCLVKVFYSDDLSVSALLEQSRNGYNLSLSGSWT
jgi:tRNA pseudouridine38-40 synthase